MASSCWRRFVAATAASAQVQTGSILVKAVDDQGGVVPGVSVTISSPVLVAGSMTGVTDAGGVNRFPSLVPGTYSVKLELAGFQTITRENIVVLVGQTTPVDFAMKVARARREHHRHRRVADRRHDERQRRAST